MYRRLYFVGIAAYIVMLVLSVLFYKERTIFLDAAFNLFNIIKDNGFCIQHYRFGDVFSQLLPVLATKAGLGINTIFECYSVGYIVYYFTTYFICGSILKRYDLALVILLMNILFVSDTFYWMLSQLPQAIALLMVIFAIIEGRQRNMSPALWIMVFLAMLTVIFFHPLVLFVLAFSVIFFVLSKIHPADKKIMYTLVIIYLTGLVVKGIFFRSYYEGSSLSGVKNFVTQFPDYFTILSNRRFLYNCVSKYYWIPVLFISISIFYFKKKSFKKLLFFAVFFAGYLMLINISYPSSSTPEFYIENLYLPLSVFLALPFVFDLLPALEKNKTAMLVIVLIILTGCVRICNIHDIYTRRLVLERHYLDEYGSNKVIVKAKKSDSDQLLMLWGTPYEFLLLSECERNKSASIIIDETPLLRDWAKGQKRALVVNWNVFPYKDLNPRYFHFRDTVAGYIVEQ
jgi:hypothetical protein